MWYYALTFLLVAAGSGILGFALSGAAGWVAKALLLVSLVLMFVSLTRAWRPA